MELTVYWTQFAENKLEDVFSYYIEQASEKIAHRLVDGIIDKSLELAKNPLIGQKEILLSDRIQEFRCLVFKNYKIESTPTTLFLATKSLSHQVSPNTLPGYSRVVGI